MSNHMAAKAAACRSRPARIATTASTTRAPFSRSRSVSEPHDSVAEEARAWRIAGRIWRKKTLAYMGTMPAMEGSFARQGNALSPPSPISGTLLKAPERDASRSDCLEEP